VPLKSQLAAQPHVNQNDENRAVSALESAQNLLDGESFAKAARLAQATLDAVDATRITPRTKARLLQVIGQASFRAMADKSDDQFDPALADLDCRERCEISLTAWQAVPGAEEEVAGVAAGCGWIAMLRGDPVKAEQRYEQAHAIQTRLYGSTDARLLWDTGYLFDLFDQQCRLPELQRELARFEHIYAAHPREVSAAFYLDRYRGVVARRNGDLSGATALLVRAVRELEGSQGSDLLSERKLKRTTLNLLEEAALDGGRYADALRFTELEPTFTDADHQLDEDEQFQLHFAYAAAGDARCSAHDQKYLIRSTRAGGEPFPKSLPAIERCAPRPGKLGWLFRGKEAEDRIARCFENSQQSNSTQASLRALMRVESGAVVAAEVAGIGADAAQLDCAARAVIALPVPAPHDFNFIDANYSAELPEP
jgi:tetratricopeptide (TPR) repeat protein